MRIIECAVNDYPNIKDKYTLPSVTIDDVLRHMLGQYYNDYYAKSTLEAKLKTLDKGVLGFLYVKNNFEEFCKVPEVKSVLVETLKGLMISNCVDVDEKTGARWINPYKHKPVKDNVKLLGEMIAELAFGFHYYEGDYVDQIYQPTMVDIVSNIKRRKIGLMDKFEKICVHRNREVTLPGL